MVAVGVIIRQNLQANHKTLKAAFGIYMGGLLVFFAMADFSVAEWRKAYYIWAMLKDVGFILTIYQLIPKFRKEIYPVLFFSLIRFTWEVISAATMKDVNHIMIVDYLFYLTLFITVAKLLNRLKKEWQELS